MRLLRTWPEIPGKLWKVDGTAEKDHGETQRFRHSSVSLWPRSGDAAPACPGFLTKCARHLPGAGLAHPGPGRGAAAARAAAVPAGRVDRRPGALRPGRRSRGAPPRPDEAGPRARGGRPDHRRRRALRPRAGRRRLRRERGLPPGLEHASPRLGGRDPEGPERLPGRGRAAVAGGGQGRPRKHPVPSEAPVAAEAMLAGAAWRRIAWRRGTKGPLAAEFAAVRVRPAEGEQLRNGWHLPGEEVWLVGERRASGERKYYLSNLAADAPLKELAATVKARWVCEQAHQQLKEELGLDHFEGRSWRGLHHHALLCRLAFAFLQHLRLGARGKMRR